MKKVILFDLDGTLLPMQQDEFINAYFKLIAKKTSHYGYNPEEIIKVVWKGTEAMIKNDGSKTNEQAFWEIFSSVYGDKAITDRYIFDEFYKNEFQQAKTVCGFNDNAQKTIKLLKERGYTVVLATSPLFPLYAVQSRVRWAGINPDDFDLITSYENINYCKPNPDYYREICRMLGLKGSDCVMIGNDVNEDMVAKEVGMDVFLLTDCLINRDGKDTSAYPQGSFKELLRYLGEE